MRMLRKVGSNNAQLISNVMFTLSHPSSSHVGYDDIRYKDISSSNDRDVIRISFPFGTKS